MAYEAHIRPRLISILCIIGFIGRIGLLPSMLSPEVRHMGDFFPALFGLFNALTFVALVGVWHMKRWGVSLYLYTFLVEMIVSVLVDHVSMVRLATAPIFIIIFLIFYRKMDRNL